MATKPKAKADLIAAEDAIGPDARDRVPFAGLLAHEPELRTAQHTRDEWQQKLAAYLHPNDISEENHAD
jgi:hypothetical protein